MLQFVLLLSVAASGRVRFASFSISGLGFGKRVGLNASSYCAQYVCRTSKPLSIKDFDTGLCLCLSNNDFIVIPIV